MQWCEDSANPSIAGQAKLRNIFYTLTCQGIEVVVVRQCLHKPNTERYRSHSSGLKYWWVIGGKSNFLFNVPDSK